MDISYTGTLTLLGNSQSEKGVTTYSIVEIKNSETTKTIQKVKIDDSLDNFLRRALKSDDEVTLWLIDDRIFGVQVEGKAYLMRPNTSSTNMGLIVIFGLLSLVIVGIPFLLKLLFSEIPAQKRWLAFVESYPEGEKVLID
jgi:hypothetical protein